MNIQDLVSWLLFSSIKVYSDNPSTQNEYGETYLSIQAEIQSL